MDDISVFRSVLREEFREELAAEESLTDRIQVGLQGLRQLNEIHPQVMQYSRQWGERIKKTKEQQTSARRPTDAAAVDENVWVQEMIDSVRWLPKIEDSLPQSLDIDEDVRFPLFPLQSTLFHPDALENEEGLESMPLPLFTPQSDIPVPGREVPLKIFEPRYRQLYSDLREKPARFRNVVVPFCHPMIPGQFAQYGLMYQMTQIQEIADETNGEIQYFANHVVTKPVQLLRVLNPQVWNTKETYLQVQGRLMDDREDMDHSVYESLKECLQQWKPHPLATKSLTALEGEGFWALVNVWTSHFQQELIQLQLGVATQVKRHAGMNDAFSVVTTNPMINVTPEVVKLAQQPHRRRLLQLLLDTSLLVPTLLSLDGPGRCQHMIRVLERERRHQ